MARQFVLVRLIRIEEADLNLFDFDFDLTWAGFFLSPDEQVYGRYGSRDAGDPDSRQSLRGLRYAMQSALEAHRLAAPGQPPEAPRPRSQRITDLPLGRLAAAQSCVHCHQVNEIRRATLRESGQWNRDDVWVYPLPENIGLVLDVDQGDRVRAVLPDSPAAQAKIAAGDRIESVGGVPVASMADVQYGLHRGPWQGELAIAWQSAGQRRSAALALPAGWKKTNLTWRPSVLELLPAIGLLGKDLTPEEKQALGLSAQRLAFRQRERVHANAAAAGVQAGDVVIGINDEPLEMTMFDFLGYIRQNFLVGDQVRLNVLRDGRRVDLLMTLK